MDFKKILFKTTSIDIEKALPDAIVFCSKDGKIQWVNDIAAEIFETSKMHLLTSNISDFIENPNGLIISSITMNRAVIVKFKDKEMYYDMTARELEDGYVLDLRDAKEPQKEEPKEDDPKIINREKNNFLLKLANDLKAPVQSIVGFSQAMTEGLGGNLSIQQEKYIKIINKNSSDLMYFISKLLELSETETALKPIEKRPMDVLSLVNSVVKFNEQLFKGKDVKISINADEEFKKTINSDNEMLKNVIQDLLEVVLKSVDMGEIVINLSNPSDEYLSSKGIVAGEYTMLTLSSSALLLSENDLESMFDPYKIVDSTNRKNVLRAIILNSVKNMIQALGGTVWVESQILKNTSFNVILPN